MDPDGARRERDQTDSDSEQTRADLDQTVSDREQTSADRDQTAADRDQRAADEDQAASDRDLDRNGDPGPHDQSRATRARGRATRRETAHERQLTALERDQVARVRDAAAAARDAEADGRDRRAAEQDQELDRMLSSEVSADASSVDQVILRAARDREHARAARERAAAARAEAARDRELAAKDREAAARDRAEAENERRTSAMDSLTGTWRREPGLTELEHEIDRARRGSGKLVVVYVDVNGLKATNDSQGHGAGDRLLTRTIKTVRSQLRPYELVVRVGGDEFICALSDAEIEDVQRRFDQITLALERTPGAGAITVGLAELTEDDTATTLVDRADRAFLAAHNARIVGT